MAFALCVACIFHGEAASVVERVASTCSDFFMKVLNSFLIAANRHRKTWLYM